MFKKSLFLIGLLIVANMNSAEQYRYTKEDLDCQMSTNGRFNLLAKSIGEM